MNIKRLPNRKLELKITIEVGSKIKIAREECGLSQKELAQLLGLKSAAAVSLWESNDRTPDSVRLWQISQVTNLPITHFL